MIADELRAFEADIAAEFNAGRIRAPVHLDGGSEEQLIEIFKDVKPGDWILGSWRQHYHALLAGVPPDELKAAILRGRSITLCFPSHRVLSSAIVGGVLPIAVGLGMGIKRRGGTERVWCFMGDMTAQTGLALECIVYAANNDLPVKWVVEANGKSVCTPSDEAWCEPHPFWRFWRLRLARFNSVQIYNYELSYPHSGAGTRVNF